MNNMALEMIRRLVSPTPMGRTPGFLSSVITRQQARRGKVYRDLHRTQQSAKLQKQLSELHRSAEADWKEVHKRCQPAASMPEGPAAPSVLRQESRITAPSRPSNIT